MKEEKDIQEPCKTYQIDLYLLLGNMAGLTNSATNTVLCDQC